MTFLLDHDVPEALARVATQAGYSVRRVREVMSPEATDAEVLAHASTRNLSYVADSKRPGDYDPFFSVEHHIQPEQVKTGGLYGGLEFHRSIHLQSGYVMLSGGTYLGPTNGAGVRQQILASSNEHRLIYPYVPGRNR